MPAVHTHSPVTCNESQPRAVASYSSLYMSVPPGSVWKGPALLSCHSGMILEEVDEALVQKILLGRKLHSLLSDSDPSWAPGSVRFPPLPSSGLILNRIHQQSEREASSPSWKQTPALVEGVEMLLTDSSCWRQQPPSSSKWLHFPSSGSLLNGHTFPGAWKLGQGIIVQQEMGCLGSQGPVCSLHLGQFLSEEPRLKALRM